MLSTVESLNVLLHSLDKEVLGWLQWLHTWTWTGLQPWLPPKTCPSIVANTVSTWASLLHHV